MRGGSLYAYAARTRDGELVRGALHAPTRQAVVELLHRRELVVTAVGAQADVVDRMQRALGIGGGCDRAELVTFFRSFVTLVRAGISLQRALAVTIERAADASLRESLRSILADVEVGLPLSEAMRRHPHILPPLYVAMIEAGETGGILDDVLERLALLLEREATVRRKLQTALAYPAVVMLVAGVLVVFLVAKIVPMFAQLFAGFHATLPLPTRLLLHVSDLVRTPVDWLVAFAALATTGWLGLRVAHTARGAERLDRLRLALPVIGPLLHRVISARVVRLLATLLRSGVELVRAIETIAPVAGSPRYARAFAAVTDALRDGESLAAPLERAQLFDPLVVALVRVGEETGTLDEMLFKLADYFESDVEASIATIGTLIEPALVVVLGAVVGCIVFSIFLPLYSLTAGLTGP